MDAQESSNLDLDATFLEALADGRLGWRFLVVDDAPRNAPLTLQRMTGSLTHPKNTFVSPKNDSADAYDPRRWPRRFLRS